MHCTLSATFECAGFPRIPKSLESIYLKIKALKYLEFIKKRVIC